MKHLSEAARLNALKKYNLVNVDITTDNTNVFRLITESMAWVCDTPYSTTAILANPDQILFLARYGIDAEDRNVSELPNFHLLMSGGYFEIPDLALDSSFIDFQEFKNNNIRFLAGHPFFDPEGVLLGCITVLDTKPRKLTAKQRGYLEKAAKRVTQIIVERRHLQVSGLIESLFESSNDLIAVSNLEGKLVR